MTALHFHEVSPNTAQMAERAKAIPYGSNEEPRIVCLLRDRRTGNIVTDEAPWLGPKPVQGIRQLYFHSIESYKREIADRYPECRLLMVTIRISQGSRRGHILHRWKA